MFIKTVRNYLPLILIFIIAIFARFIFLDQVPNAIGGDEIVYILNAKASFITGHDIFGEWSPWKGLLFSYPRGETQAELPYIINSIFVGPLPFSLLNAKLANALMGVFIVLFIYLIAKELLDKKTAVFAAFIASINPWLVYIGRTAYEAIPASLFYLIAFYILLKAKGWQILLAFPVLVLAFYSYIATKLILLPFLFVAIIYCYFVINSKKYLKQYVLLFLLSLLFIAFFALSLKLNPHTSRLDEILTPYNSDVVREVDAIRKTSIQTVFTNIFVNKYTVFLNIVITKIIKTFASDYLFVHGDEFFSVWKHGLFYYIDSLFLFLGGIFMFAKKRKPFLFFAVLALVGIVPQVVHTAKTDSFSIHSAFLYLILILIIAFGVSELTNWFKKSKFKLTATLIIVAIYLFSFTNFMNIYLYWFTLQGYFDFPIRVVSEYSKRVGSNQKITIISNTSFDFYKKFIFYSDAFNKDSAKIISNNLKNEKYTLGNVTFVSCTYPKDLKLIKDTLILDVKCGLKFDLDSKLSIARLKDGGESFQIYNDNVCRSFNHKQYPYGLKLSDFKMDKLTDKEFCEAFITSL